jgi:hypothetical protein
MKRATYAESQVFADLRRPKIRNARPPKPGARVAPEMVLHITEDTTRGIALIRGRGIDAVLDTAGVLNRARWSQSAKGWVLDVTDLGDVIAVAEHSRAIVRTGTLGGEVS